MYNSKSFTILISNLQFFTIPKSNQMLDLGERVKLEYPEKTSRSRVGNQQTQPTYDAKCGNRTWDTLVEGEHSHHCANPAPQLFKIPPSPPDTHTPLSLHSPLSLHLSRVFSHRMHSYAPLQADSVQKSSTFNRLEVASSEMLLRCHLKSYFSFRFTLSL